MWHNVKKQLPGGFLQKDVLKNLPKFTGKHLCWSLFFNKVSDLRSAYRKSGTKTLGPTQGLGPTYLVCPRVCNLIEKEAPTQVFSCEFCEIFKNTLFYRTPPAAASGCNNIKVVPIAKSTKFSQKIKCLLFSCFISQISCCFT